MKNNDDTRGRMPKILHPILDDLTISPTTFYNYVRCLKSLKNEK